MRCAVRLSVDIGSSVKPPRISTCCRGARRARQTWSGDGAHLPAPGACPQRRTKRPPWLCARCVQNVGHARARARAGCVRMPASRRRTVTSPCSARRRHRRRRAGAGGAQGQAGRRQARQGTGAGAGAAVALQATQAGGRQGRGRPDRRRRTPRRRRAARGAQTQTRRTRRTARRRGSAEERRLSTHECHGPRPHGLKQKQNKKKQQLSKSLQTERLRSCRGRRKGGRASAAVQAHGRGAWCRQGSSSGRAVRGRRAAVGRVGGWRGGSWGAQARSPRDGKHGAKRRPKGRGSDPGGAEREASAPEPVGLVV